MPQSSFRAGIAQQDLPAYPGLDLSGYALRIQPCLAVRDNVSATALALENNGVLFVLISADALGFTINTADEVRENITSAARKFGAWKEIHVCLAATHSHAAPASMSLRECGNVSAQWLDDTCEIIARTAIESVENLQAARFGDGSIEVSGVTLNRRKSTFVDNELSVWRIDLENGKPLAAVINFACHPVVLSHENRAISADYLGEVRSALQEDLQIPVLFLTGAAGDINPVYRGGNEAIVQTAAPLIDGVKKLWPQMDTSTKVLLRGNSQRLELPLLDRPPHEELKIIATKDPLPARRAWVDQALQKPPDALLTVPCVVQTWRVGSSALAAVGCELFVSFGLRFKSTFKKMEIQSPLIAAYANGNLGYVPDADAYERGGYEVNSAHYYYAQPACVTPEAGEILANAVTLGMNSLKGESSK